MRRCRFTGETMLGFLKHDESARLNRSFRPGHCDESREELSDP
jgi:hypothetical protein